jgi:hypothetical protein
MHIDAFDKFQNFLTLKRDWDSVYKADPEAQFFLSWTWMSRWLKIGGLSELLGHFGRETTCGYVGLRCIFSAKISDQKERMRRQHS